MKKKKPEIRFNGFEGEWATTTLGECSKKITTKNNGNEYNIVLTNSAERGIVDQRSYFDREIVNTENIQGYYIVSQDDFVYNPRISMQAPVGPINRSKIEYTGVMSPLYYVFRITDKRFSLTYLEWFFKSSSWHNFMYKNGNSGARSDRFSINDDVFLKLPIYHSKDISEQEKIGLFLTTLDKLIAKLEAKLDKLRKLKQALLEKMFVNVNRGGYETPEIRFKGYTDKWQVKELGELAIFNPPNQPLKELFYYIDLESVEKGFLKIKEQVTKRMAPSRAQRTLEFNDILFQTVRPYLQNHYLFKKNTQNNQWVASTGYALLRPKIYPELLYTMLLSEGFMQEVMQRCTGSTYPAINSKKMTDIKVGCSSVQMEQQLIGDLFILLDNQLNKTSTKLTKLRNIKQSLLQKMFA